MIPLISTNSSRLFRWLDAQLLPLVETWQQAAEHRRQRRELMALDDRMLRDIGVSRADVEKLEAEAPRPLVKVPRYAPARHPAITR